MLTSAARAEIRVAFGYSGSYNPAVLELNGAAQLSAFDQGWFDQYGNRELSEGNYIAGVCGLPFDYCNNFNDVVYRDFFAFNLAASRRRSLRPRCCSGIPRSSTCRETAS